MYTISIFVSLNKFKRYHTELNPLFKITYIKYSQVKFDKRSNACNGGSFKVASEGFASRWYLVKFGNLESNHVSRV